jgi:hypothetical protein
MAMIAVVETLGRTSAARVQDCVRMMMRHMQADLEGLVCVEVERQAAVWEEEVQATCANEVCDLRWQPPHSSGDRMQHTVCKQVVQRTRAVSSYPPKLSRSFRHTSRAKALMAPGYCTGSSSTTCESARPLAQSQPTRL